MITHFVCDMHPMFSQWSLGIRCSVNGLWASHLMPETLHNFWLSQMKDCHRASIVVISVIMAPNRLFCEKKRWLFSWSCDQRYDTAWSSHRVFAATIHIYWRTNENAIWNQRDMALKHKTTYLKLLSLPLSPLPLFSANIKNTTAKVWLIMLFLIFYSTVVTCVLSYESTHMS